MPKNKITLYFKQIKNILTIKILIKLKINENYTQLSTLHTIS